MKIGEAIMLLNPLSEIRSNNFDKPSDKISNNFFLKSYQTVVLLFQTDGCTLTSFLLWSMPVCWLPSVWTWKSPRFSSWATDHRGLGTRNLSHGFTASVDLRFGCRLLSWFPSLISALIADTAHRIALCENAWFWQTWRWVLMSPYIFLLYWIVKSRSPKGYLWCLPDMSTYINENDRGAKH